MTPCGARWEAGHDGYVRRHQGGGGGHPTGHDRDADDPFAAAVGVVGAARACYEAALRYSQERVQFDRPIGGFQLIQRKLADMAVSINRAGLLALHLGRMKDAGEVEPAHISMGKLDNVREALRVAREARNVLGANGITLEYPVMRHMSNLESVYTYEGTEEVHTLVVGQTITGLNAFT